MRVSTNTIYEQGVFNMLQGQARLLKTQDQIATGRRVLTPADDPVAASRALEVSQSQAVNRQFMRNADSAESAIALQEEALKRYTRLLQDVKTLAVNAGNGALSSRELKNIASELRGRYDELMGIANTTDANGQYLFSGYQGNSKPFAETAPGQVAYLGDEGKRLIQISPSRDVPVSFSGADVFQRIRDGNGTFVTAAGASNVGTGVITAGSVRDRAAWDALGNPKNFEIRFAVDTSTVPPSTTYDIVDTVNNVSLTTGIAPAGGPYPRTYTSGASISVSSQSPPDTNPVAFDYGIDFVITGEPADGDAFTVTPSGAKDIFATLDELITTLESAGPGATLNTRLTNALNTAQNSLDNALDVNLTVLAAVGAYAREVDVNRSAAQDLDLQFSTQLSGLRDLDYAEAITRLTYQQVSLEAAQKSFLRIQELSLFSYL